MLLHQHPAFTYITWQGLVIVEYDPFDNSKVMQQYIISDDKTCDKYVYWDKQDPYILKTSNEWVTSNATIKLLFINDEGEGTEVPVEDIDYFYTNKGSSSGSVISGKMLGMFNEIDGKFVSITEDIDGIRQTIGEITGEGGSNATTTERLNKLEQTVEGNTQTISEVKTRYEQNEEEEKLRNDVNVAFIDMMTILSEYERIISTASKDLVIEDIEKIDIDNQKNKLIAQLSIINACHEIITERVKDVETLDEIERANVLLNDTVSGLNNHVTTIISGGKIDISDITTMLNYIADTSLKIKNYQGVLSDALLLGVGGSVISNIHTMTETSREYNRGITALEEVVNGETGLVETVESHGTWITQTAEDLSLKYVKYNETTAELTVSDETIKLDAGKVLMTGTLTWDSLDQDAKENLKGEDGVAEYITISGDQIFKYNENGDPNVEFITLSAVTSNLGNLLFTWYYRDINDTWVKITTTDIGEYIINHDDSIWENRDAITIRVSVTKDVITYYDDMTLVKIRDGIDGTKNYVMVTGNQIFKYEDSFETTPTPMSLALTGTCYGFTTDIYSWYYENTNGEWTRMNNEVSNVLILPHTSPYFEGRETLTIKFEAGLYSDTITIAKLLDGSDGYYVTLTNQAHVVPCDENGNYNSSDLENVKTEIHVYRGATEVGFSFSKVDKGCASIYNSSTKTLSLTTLTNDSATVTITITVNNKSFVKVMNIAKVKKGSMGEGLTVKGYFNSVDELPTIGNVVGDAYIIDTKLYIWSDKTNAWSDGIEFAGREGIPGKDGADGRTTYIHIKYSNDGKTFTSNNGETPGKWMGQYTDFIEQDSTDFNTYTWFKVQGEDGYNGIVANLTNDTHVIPCNADGSYGTDAFAGCITQIILSYNGTQIDSGITYSYVKSNSILGTFTSSNGKFTATGWSDNSATSGYVDMIANYEGVNYTKRFTIIKAKGGNDSITINFSNDSHVFVANQNGDLIGETSTTINVTAYKGENKVTATIGTLPTVTGLTLSKSGETITIRASKTMATVGSIAIPITVGNISTERYFNYSKVTCGNDGYTVMLTNESEIFNCASDGLIKEVITKTTRVLAYKGTAQATPTIGTLPTVTGLTLTKSGDTITIEANTGANLAENGYFDIPITVDGVSFTKRFSWTKVRNGSAGDLPTWITDWNSNITTINNTSVISPKIFAGTVTNGVPTGVAIGKNVFGTSGTYSNVNGIVGYKNGTKNYEFNVNGDILIGNIDDQYISWTSSGLKINADTITLNSQGVATSSQLQTTQNGILTTVSETYATKTQFNTTNDNITTAQTTADNALSKANTADTNATNALNKANTNASNITTITTKQSSLEQTVDEISTKISSVETTQKGTLKSTSIQYYLSTSLTTLSGGSWQDTAPTWTQGKYMWQRMKYEYVDGNITYSTPVCIAGAKGDTGATGNAGVGVKSITNYYLATNSSSGVTTSNGGWTTTIQTVSSTKKYLWNYEKITYTNDSTVSTTPCIIGNFSTDGTNGTDGVGISSITEYYQVSTSNTTAPTTWSTTPPTLTKTNKYLWSYEEIIYTNSTTKETSKRVIGVYGDTGATGSAGEKGQSLVSSTPQWYLSSSKTSQTGGNWVNNMPAITDGYYLWLRYKLVWENPTATTYTTPTLEQVAEAVKVVSNKQSTLEQDLNGFKTTVYETQQQIQEQIDTNTAGLEIITNKQSSLEQSVNGFKTEVSNTYATKSEVQDAGEANDNLIVNGRFLGAEPKMAGSDMAPWYMWGAIQVYRMRAYDTINKNIVLQMTSESEGGGIYQDVIEVPSNTELTLSFYCDWQQNVQQPVFDITYYYDGTRLDDSTYVRGMCVKGDNVLTFTTPNEPFTNFTVGFVSEGLVTGANGSYVNWYLNKVKIEVGNIATPWVENINYIENTYTTKTEFQQTNEDFTFRIAQSGGGNLIKNSLFKSGMNYWSLLNWDNSDISGHWWNVVPSYSDLNMNKDNCIEISARVHNPYGILRTGIEGDWIEVKPNTEYSFSGYIASHRSNNIAFEIYHDEGTGYSTYMTGWSLGKVGEGYIGAKNYDCWTRIEKTFITTENTKKILIRLYMESHNHDSDTSAYMWLALPCLVKGSIPLDWSPHASEIYDGIVKIDSRGVTVQQGNNHSTLDSEALNFYAGDIRYSRVKGGRFEFTNNDGSVIGGVGKSTWAGTNKGISSVNATYGHSVSLGAQRGVDENYTSSLIVCSQDGPVSSSGGYYFGGLNMSTPKVMGVMYIRGSSNDTIDLRNQGMMIYANYGDGYRTGCIFGNEEVHIGTQYGTENWDGLIIKENGTQNSKNELHVYGPLDMHNYPITRTQVTSSVSATSTYTTRLLNEGSIQNMTYGGTTFTEGELRYTHRQTCHTVEEWDYNDEGVWSPLGVYYCYCELPIFMAENIELDYHVNIGKIGWGDYRVIEKNPYLFIVESQEEGFAFTWEVVAKQLEKATNNVVVANEYVSTGRSQPLPTEDSDFTYELDKEEFIEEEEELQGNINTGEE